jgi:hypothetical protein
MTTKQTTPISKATPQQIDPAILEALSGDTLVACFTRPGRDPNLTSFWLEQINEAPTQVTVRGLIEEAQQARRRLQGLGVGRGDRARC